MQPGTNIQDFSFKWAWWLVALKPLCYRFVDTPVVVFTKSMKSLLPETFFPLNWLFSTWTVLPPNLQYVCQSKRWSRVVLEAGRSRRSLAGQQGHHPTATPPTLCKIAHTQRKDGALRKSLLQSFTAPHPDNKCLPTSCLAQLTHRDDPEAFLWVYEGLAVTCELLKEEAGREQPSSDYSLRATLLY